MKSPNHFLYDNEVRMRIINQIYVYMVHIAQSVLNIVPPPLRTWGWRILIRKVGKYTFFDHNIYIKYPWLVEIGEHVSINRGAHFFPGYKERHKIILGNHVYVAPNVGFFAAGHDIHNLTQHVGGNITVDDGVWIGANSVILPGIHIGKNSVIGAGSVVTKDIPDDSVAAGNPAKIIKRKESLTNNY